MKAKAFLKKNLLFLITVVIALAFCVYGFLKVGKEFAFFMLVSIVFLSIAYVVIFFVKKKKSAVFLREYNAQFDFSSKNAIEQLPFPILVSDEKGNIVWYNDAFLWDVLNGVSGLSTDISPYISDHTLQDIFTINGIGVTCEQEHYSVYHSSLSVKNEKHHVLFYLKDTELNNLQNKYTASKPVLLYIALDGEEELQSRLRDSECTEILGKVESLIDEWAIKNNAILQKLDNDKYLIVAQEKSLQNMIDDRFGILNAVRDYKHKDKKSGLTLSIGVGRGDDFIACESRAKQALDMARGRGGDQAAVRNANKSYEFFGGVNKGTSKLEKVKSRIVASAFSELISGSDNVIVMGHRCADFDCIGAALGVACAARALDKDVKTCIDQKTASAQTLLQKLNLIEDLTKQFIKPEQAKSFMKRKTLLVVVDTHIAEVAEVPSLFEDAKTIVIIDHHRLAVNSIENAVIFHHDPLASSASELVVELLQYITPTPVLTKDEAEALLAGIMLDTKNFVLHTGIHTFEAAAYLKKMGADTIQAKKLFADSMDSFRLRNDIVETADKCFNCAICVAKETSPDIRIICAQAADALLTIEGVDASFVMFVIDDTIHISARSYGAVNVQLIMERMGGGGHHTMAAAQLDLNKYTVENAMEQLKQYIADYYKEHENNISGGFIQ